MITPQELKVYKDYMPTDNPKSVSLYIRVNNTLIATIYSKSKRTFELYCYFFWVNDLHCKKFKSEKEAMDALLDAFCNWYNKVESEKIVLEPQTL